MKNMNFYNYLNNLKKKLELWNEYRNPFYHYWKVRKLFKRPKCHFKRGKNIWFFGLCINKKYYNPILSIKLHGLGWKTKWDEYRHEWDPYIQIRLFRKWDLIWIFNWVDKNDEYSSTRSMATWEAILGYLYDQKDLKKCIDNNQWLSGGDRDNAITITPYDNLTKLGKNIYNKK